jgi:ribosomal protein L37E
MVEIFWKPWEIEREMPYCKQCQLIHGEEHRFCQRCGQLLKSTQAGARSCNRCGSLTYPGQKFCTDCGLPLRVARVVMEDEPPATRPPLFYPRNADPRNRRPRRRPKLALYFLGIILLILGGVYMWARLPRGVTAPRVPTVSTPQDDTHRDVEKLAEKIRSAHLNKDINKWLSCYHPSYPQLGRLESQILELWKNYDVREVSYRISNVKRQNDHQASADLVWNIQVWDHRTHDYTLLRPSYRIMLEKTDGDWKIRDSREEGGGPS